MIHISLAPKLRRHSPAIGLVVAVSALVAALAVTVQPASAVPGSFTNPATITINNAPAPESVSSIVVSGQPTALSDVNVTLNGFSHSAPADVDVLLEGPTGVRVMLMSDAPDQPLPFTACETAVSNLNLTFDDAAPATIPNLVTLASGTYRPTDNDSPPASCDAGDGGVPAPTGTTLAAFNGTNPNGTWKLHVVDDRAASPGGTINNGWSLSIDPTLGVCDGKAATKVGTSHSETIVGTAGDDVIVGGGGKDTIKGLAGNDTICGGTGKDILKGGSGDDRLFGDNGKDTLRGGSGLDNCTGGLARDTFSSCETRLQ